MKYLRIILMLCASLCFANCNAQNDKNKSKVVDKSFRMLLDRFRDVTPPVNYKKMTESCPSMTKEEAMKFLNKTEEDLIRYESEYGEDENGNEQSYTYEEEHTAGCGFKYKLNDSVFILCTREYGQGDTFFVYLNSFSINAELISKCVVGEQLTLDSDWISFVLLDKEHIRVFYYNDDYLRREDGWLSKVYYVNYLITEDGKFIEQDKSGIVWLKKFAIDYQKYKPNSDDPMNKYNF